MLDTSKVKRFGPEDMKHDYICGRRNCIQRASWWITHRHRGLDEWVAACHEHKEEYVKGGSQVHS